ncbi:aldo/keto reductase [Flavisolibacter nicotianae]|uniref:aldo/keto reductase n=1 Tax=Flavisolibacter nicotianae TaxID=2364882 RepID=UPI000EB299F7|nr:aldo/keto reductase [Flavisolibacter nicotianae]
MNEPLTLSKLTLGTVQLGLPYGVANTSGQPETSYSHELLQFALDKGIRILDTARAYGNAEQVIGSFANRKYFTCISKFKLSPEALDNPSLAIAEARQSAITSCEMLNVDCLPVLLFHKGPEEPIEKVASLLPLIFKTLKSEGLIGEGGLSAYTPDELICIRDWETIRSVQVPMNVFDTRLLQGNLLQTLAEKNVRVFVRSVYLQGLLLMETHPPHLSFAKPYLDQLEAIAKKADRTIKELAFAFVRDTPGVSSIVVGAETIGQVQENIELLATPPLPEHITSEIKQRFAAVPLDLITPARWPQKQTT